MEGLPKIKEKYKDKKIVFCSGVFDLTHAGHIFFFEKCREYGDILVVGVGGDLLIKKRKGEKRPILNEKIRLKTIDSLKPVNFSFIDNISNSENPLFLLDIALEKLKPNVYVINEDAFDIPYREKLCNEFNVNLVIFPKEKYSSIVEGLSTSKIIERIKELD
tara:strand:- start:78 stop:563 length:486 start_codon:yes stop_codon:yes gene_type:complete